MSYSSGSKGNIGEESWESIKKKFKPYIDGESRSKSKIKRVWMYKVNLFPYQWTSYVLFHNFVLFETEDGMYWTIEKNSASIVLQCNEDKEKLIKYLNGEERNTAWSTFDGQGNTTIAQLWTWLKSNMKQYSWYHFFLNNCKLFARRVYDYIVNPKADVRCVSYANKVCD